jgi:hypothetical protein
VNDIFLWRLFFITSAYHINSAPLEDAKETLRASVIRCRKLKSDATNEFGNMLKKGVLEKPRAGKHLDRHGTCRGRPGPLLILPAFPQ